MSFTPNFTAPSAEVLISDLLAASLERDPQNKEGFSSRELWEWRYATYGYRQLMADWLSTFHTE